MTQPRKEQINDQRSYYTNINAVGAVVPVPFGTPDVAGGTIQTIQNNITENYYNEFLANTITQTPGGSETDTSGFLFGATGPFVSPIVSGASFTITLPNINLGNPVLVTFQPSDSVNINSVPYITTSKVAQRINAALTSAGVYPLSPIAANVNGQLVLTSAGPSGYTIGDAAFITVNDVTIGVCSALGFTSTNSAVGTGVSSPQRGIITTSADSLGGYIQFRIPDGSPAITKSNIQVNVGGFGFLPIYPSGQVVYGRLQQFSGFSSNPKFVVSYYRNGAVAGSVITNGENCSTILTSDAFTVVVSTTNPALFPLPNSIRSVQNYVLPITFSVAPLGPQDVINAVNTAWNAAAQASGFFPSGMEAGRGGVVATIPGPWQFTTGQDNFFLILNGHAPLTISPPTGVYSSNDLANYINSVIATAGQTGQGQATVINFPIGDSSSSISISSAVTTGSSSTVQIVAGDLVGLTSNPKNSYVTTLNKLGISPGVYSGSVVAKLYGNDEIKFVCPDHMISDPYGAPSGITVYGPTLVMAKLGLTGTPVAGIVTIAGHAGLGFELVTPVIMQALVPEVLNFGEVPDNIETTTNRFANSGYPLPINPGAGTGNVGVSPLLGLDGKINPDLFSKILDVLNLETLTLGSSNLGSIIGNAIPRLITGFSNSTSVGLTLIWQAASTAGLDSAPQIWRLYFDQNGGIWLTSNAAWHGIHSSGIGGQLTWTPDTTSQSASAVYVSQLSGLDSTFGPSGTPQFELFYAPPTLSTGFVFPVSPGSGIHTGPVGFDSSGAAGSSQAFITSGTTVVADIAVPRYQSAVYPFGNYTLIWQTTGVPGAIPNVRVYTYSSSGPEIDYWLTLNSSWNGVAWVKDVAGMNSSALQLQTINGTILSYFTQLAADNTAWTVWDTNPFFSQMNATGVGSGMTLTGGSADGSTNLNGAAGVLATGGANNGTGVVGLGTTGGAGIIGVGGGGTEPTFANYTEIGVVGQGGSSNNLGVFGQGTGSGPGTAGIGGPTAGTPGGSNSVGVAGFGGGGGSYGVFGGGTTTFAGVYGKGGPGTSDITVGVYGDGQGSNNGVLGVGGSSSGAGVVGVGGGGVIPALSTTEGTGVTGVGGSTGYGFGVAGIGGSGFGYGVYGLGSPSGAPGGFFTGVGSHNGVDSTGGSPAGAGGGTGVNGTGGSPVSGNETGGIGVTGLGGTKSGSGGDGSGVQGTGGGTSGIGVVGQGASTGAGITGLGGAGGSQGGVFLGSGTHNGVDGTGGSQGFGNSSGGTGVNGTGGAKSGTGLDGIGISGNGGGSTGGVGVQGVGSGAGPGVVGVGGGGAVPGLGITAATGVTGVGGSGGGFGVYGVGEGAGPGVQGQGATGGSGHGVVGIGATSSGAGVVGTGSAAGGNGVVGTAIGIYNGGDFDAGTGIAGGGFSQPGTGPTAPYGAPLAVKVTNGPISVQQDFPLNSGYAGRTSLPGKNNLWGDNIPKAWVNITTNGNTAHTGGLNPPEISFNDGFNIASCLWAGPISNPSPLDSGWGITLNFAQGMAGTGYAAVITMTRNLTMTGIPCGVVYSANFFTLYGTIGFFNSSSSGNVPIIPVSTDLNSSSYNIQVVVFGHQ